MPVFWHSGFLVFDFQFPNSSSWTHAAVTAALLVPRRHEAHVPSARPNLRGPSWVRAALTFLVIPIIANRFSDVFPLGRDQAALRHV